MRDAIEYLKDRWEWDTVWRDQVLLAVIVGAIGFAYVLLEVGARNKWQPATS